MIKINRIKFMFCLLFIFSLVTMMAYALPNSNMIGNEIVNASNGTASQGGGFVVYCNNGITTNGTSLAALSVTQNFGYVGAVSVVNLSKWANINLSLLVNGSHGNYVNMTFSWILASNLSETFNQTLATNTTANQSVWNLSFNTATITQGLYNITIHFQNATPEAPGSALLVNFSRGYYIAVDNLGPTINHFGLGNYSVGVNFTSSTLSNLNFTVYVNDSVTRDQAVLVGFRQGNGTEQNVTLSRQMYYWTGTLVTATLSEGVYTGTAYANDVVSNMNSTSNVTFTIDRTGPNVTSILVGNYSSGVNLSAGLAPTTGNSLLNLSVIVNDSFTKTGTVYFNVTNNTGTVFSTSSAQGYFFATNLTATYGNNYSGTYYANGTLAQVGGPYGNLSGAINLSALPEGSYTVKVWANDTLNNVNLTENFTFTIDRTNPTVSVSCSPSNPTSGQTVSCTCTASDSGTGLQVAAAFSGGGTSESTTATASGTSSTCSATDYVGNRQTGTGSWTLASSSSGGGGGGGGGGSGGGVSTGVANQFEKKVWTSLNKGETATITTKDGELGVTQVQFTAREATYGVTLQVEKVATLPTTITGVTQKVYKYVKITQSNVDKAIDGVAKIDFKVTKDWLKQNNLGKEQVVLYRNVDNKWTALKTTVGADDGTYVSYTAETPGFSYFAIGQGAATVAAPAASKVAEGKKESGATPSAPSTSEAGATTAQATPVSEAEQAATTGTSTWVWIVFVLAIGVVVLVVYWWLKK